MCVWYGWLTIMSVSYEMQTLNVFQMIEYDGLGYFWVWIFNMFLLTSGSGSSWSTRGCKWGWAHCQGAWKCLFSS